MRWGLAAIALLLFAVVMLRLFSASTPPITDLASAPLPDAIASLERIELGGVDQWLLIRGANRSHPVLLWLHGGPGAAQMPVARHYNGSLESEFVVVHWDQRGAGKSNHRGFDPSSMRFEQFVRDAHQLTRHLKARFGRDAIVLLGHSWGTQLGTALVREHPEDYLAYVAVSQVVNGERATEIAHRWLLERVKAAGEHADWNRLRALGEPPYIDHADYVAFANLVDAYGGGMDRSFRELVGVALRAAEYTPLDHLRWLGGARRGSGPMWNDPDYADFDAFESVPRLAVPTYFISGSDDYNTPVSLVGEYCAALDAPAGKRMITLPNAAHTPFLASPERFHDVLVAIRRDLAASDSRAMAEGAPCTT